MINFCEAVNHAMQGKTIIAYTGYRYTTKEILPISCGPNWVMLSSRTKTLKSERENLWIVEE